MQKNKEIVTDLLFALVMIIVVIIISVSFWPGSDDIIITCIFLFAAWILDALFKYALGLGSHTMFADLSFTGFILMAGKVLSLLIELIDGINKSNSLVELVGIMVLLGLLWLLNLFICRSFVAQQSAAQQNQIWVALAWAISCFISMISSSLVLYPQYIGMI